MVVAGPGGGVGEPTGELCYRGVLVRDYVHPHVAALATEIVDDFMTAGEMLPEVAHKKASDVPPMSGWLDRAITEYRDNILPGDPLMLAALDRRGKSPAPEAGEEC